VNQQQSPYGFPFLEIKQTEQLESLSRACQVILKENGFKRVMPPTLDYDQTFALSKQSSFNIRDHLGEELSLRTDVTLQLVKGLAHHHEGLDWNKQQRFYYTVPVFKDVRKTYPSLREVFQLGAEIFGLETEEAILTLIILAKEVMKEIPHQRYTTIIGSIEIANQLESFLGVDCIDALETKDAPFIAQALETKGFQPKEATIFSIGLFFHPLPRFLSENKIMVTKLDEDFNLELQKNWDQLLNFTNKCERSGVFVTPMPLIKGRTDYYSSIIFECYIDHKVNPPLRGGAYDTLFQKFSNINVNAAGFALDLSSLIFDQ
jgi:histidyl-tRNA synthetase